jgi:hypothetical protein
MSRPPKPTVTASRTAAIHRVATGLALLYLLAGTGLGAPARAETPEADELALAVADAALAAISEEDFIALTDLMLESTTIYAAGERDGKSTVRRRGYAEERAQAAPGDLLERGWDPEVRVAGSVAMVWYPYDLWLDGEWIHCGVDIFNLVQTDAGWRIATIVYSADQPPVCSMHPDGPPPGVAETP